MYTLNDKIKNLVPYDPIAGEYRIRLDANESMFPLSDEMLAQMQNAVASVNYNRYPDPTAKQLRETYADLYGIDPELITCGNGSDELLGILVGAFCEAGDKLLTVAPDFSMYRFYGEVYGVENVVYQKPESLEIDVDALLAMLHADPKIRMLLFSNPCNPTSLGLTADKVEKLIQNAGNCLIVLDEAYMDFFGEEHSFLKRVEEFDNLIVLRTCSKALGMAAIRLGLAVANPTLTRALTAVKSPYNINSMTQAVGCALLADKELLHQRNAEIIVSRDALYKAIKPFEGGVIRTVFEPKTNFVFIDFGDPQIARQVFEGFLAHSIAIRYMGRYLRITAGSPAENAAVIALLPQLLDEVKGGN